MNLLTTNILYRRSSSSSNTIEENVLNPKSNFTIECRILKRKRTGCGGVVVVGRSVEFVFQFVHGLDEWNVKMDVGYSSGIVFCFFFTKIKKKRNNK